LGRGLFPQGGEMKDRDEFDRDIKACTGMFENPDEKTKEICRSFIDNVYMVREKYNEGEIEDVEDYKERVIGLYQAMFILGADHSILDEIMERVYPQ
jgi:hypothetical protein